MFCAAQHMYPRHVMFVHCTACDSIGQHNVMSCNISMALHPFISAAFDHVGCMVPTAGSEAMERIMLWQITNLQQGGCATYLNGASLLHRLTEHCSALSTAGEAVITNVTIETIGEAQVH